jgi:hypothetical protein
MPMPNLFLAYAPEVPGLRCALAYLASDGDAYGWFTGPRHDGSLAASYFVLEDFYSDRQTRYDAVDAAELHSSWLLDEPRRHQLARMQERFAREWLCYPAAGQVNVRFERLARFSTLHPTWTYFSPGFERPVLRQLARRWPLEYRLHAAPAAAPRRRRAVRSCP